MVGWHGILIALSLVAHGFERVRVLGFWVLDRHLIDLCSAVSCRNQSRHAYMLAGAVAMSVVWHLLFAVGRAWFFFLLLPVLPIRDCVG